jgi:hypothetical protein
VHSRSKLRLTLIPLILTTWPTNSHSPSCYNHNIAVLLNAWIKSLCTHFVEIRHQTHGNRSWCGPPVSVLHRKASNPYAADLPLEQKTWNTFPSTCLDTATFRNGRAEGWFYFKAVMIDYSFKGGRPLFLLYLRTKDTSACFINIGQESMRWCYKISRPVSANGVGNGGLIYLGLINRSNELDTNCFIMNFISYSPSIQLGRTCNMYSLTVKRIQNLWWKTLTKRDHLEDLIINRRIILKCIFIKLGLKDRAGINYAQDGVKCRDYVNMTTSP